MMLQACCAHVPGRAPPPLLFHSLSCGCEGDQSLACLPTCASFALRSCISTVGPNDPHVPRQLEQASVAPALPANQNPLAGLRVEGVDPAPVLADDARGVWLYRGNSLAALDAIAERYPDGLFDMIFADPPYFLSNGGITCHAGRMVKVDKGSWDKSRGPELNHE